jgi:hypothetical protein
MRYLIIVLCAASLLALNSVASAQDAEALAAAGKWTEAIEAYGQELTQMTAPQYRDKKDFEWVLDEFVKTSPKDYEPLKKTATQLLTKHKGSDIYEWRLHRLLADIAQKQADKDTEQKELDLAIAAYPPETSNEPSKLSSLQHLYNRRALLTADKDAKAAEDYLLKAFKTDPRFVYFFGSPWQAWYEQANQPQGYQQLQQRVQKIYGEKAATDPKHRSLLQRYAKLLAAEMKPSR